MTNEAGLNAEAYNFAEFPPATGRADFAGFKERGPRVGQQAPDFEATLLDGLTVRLVDIIAKGPVVIEFGSIT